jgi:hypothetical protein
LAVLGGEWSGGRNEEWIEAGGEVARAGMKVARQAGWGRKSA